MGLQVFKWPLVFVSTILSAFILMLFFIWIGLPQMNGILGILSGLLGICVGLGVLTVFET